MTNCNSCGGTTVFVAGNIVKCEYCGRLYSTSDGELSDAVPEQLYSSAVSMSKSQNEETLKSAIEIFEALGSYKDSATLANSCRGMIAKSRMEAEERRLAAERQAELERIQSEKRAFEEKQKAKIRRIVLAAVSAVAVIAVGISIISNSNKSFSYSKAVELYSIGQYEEAREAFNDLGDYSDAATYVSTIDNFLTERESKYEKGVSYYEKGAYIECIAALGDISGYLDSEDYIEKSVEAIYQQATQCYDAGEFEEAKELLEKIPESSSKNMDAEILLADIEEILIEQTNAANYEQAKEYYDNGDYETAQRLFIGLGNYEESTTYLATIGTNYYEQANELFKQKEYVKCGEVLQYIDTAGEWNDYLKANELLKNATSAYIDEISKEARAICRSEGYSSMVTFVDSKVCVLLPKEQASSLKQECTVEVVSFEDLEPYVEGNFMYERGYSKTDTMGNTYAYAFRGYMDIEDGGAYAIYDISGRYKYFNATVAVNEKWTGSISEKCI